MKDLKILFVDDDPVTRKLMEKKCRLRSMKQQ